MLNILRSTAKNTIIYSFGTFSSRLVGFILIPLYTTKLSVSEYGMLGMLDISSQVLVSLFGLGLFNAFFRWYWAKDSVFDRKSLLFTILATVIFFSGIISLLGISFSSHLSSLILDSWEFGNLIRLLFVAVSLEAIIVVYSTLYRIKDKALLFSSLMLVKLIVSLSLTVYLIAYRGRSVEGIYMAQIMGSLVYLIIGTFFITNDIKFRVNLKLLRVILQYSLPLTIVAIVGIVLNTTDRYVLKFFTDLEEVGKYSLGFKISNTLRVFIISSVSLAVQPVIFKMIDQPNNKRFYSKVMTYFSFGLIICVMFFSFFGKEIIKVISASNMSYWDAYKVIPILSLGIFFSMLRDVSLTGINITKRTSITAKIITICMVFNIGLCILLTYLFNFVGAAIAATLSQLLFFILVYRASQRVYPIPYEIKKVILMVAIAAIMYLCVLYIDNFNLTVRLIAKSLLILSYPFILYLFCFYEDIEIQRIRHLSKKWANLSELYRNLKRFSGA